MTSKDDKTIRVTMKDVARAAGVSQSTVSFVLSGTENMRISAETRARVLEAVEALGYRSRAAGRPTGGQGHRVIGLMFDEIATSPFASISIEGLQEEAWKQGVIVEVVMTGGDRAHETAVLNKWAADRVHGVAYASILTREITPPDALARHKAVLLNCTDSTGRVSSIVPAERRGAELATRTLIEVGHRRIAFITGEPWMDASVQRQEGYKRALSVAQIEVDPALIVEGNFLPSGGHAATVALLESAQPPDAIFCANDLMAIGCYEALKERGHRIGETIGVMGYDDQEVAQHLSPRLSTVLLPHREMGQWCARKLLDSSDMNPEAIRLEGPIMIRQSHLGVCAPETTA